MCGHCIESAVVLDFVAHEVCGEDYTLNNNWVEIYIQETKNVLNIAERTKDFINFKHALPAAFCRAWDSMLKNEHSEQNAFLDLFNAEDKAQFLSKLKERDPFDLTRILSDGQLYTTNDLSKELFRQKEALIKSAEKTLSWYCDWWLFGQSKAFSDPGERMKETGIMDPIDNTTPEDFETFHQVFPIVYCCLLILIEFSPDSSLIESIALNDPYDVPDFSNRDLWLQRTAFLFCLRKQGVKYIEDHYEKIRLELIYYGLLRKQFSTKELEVLQDLIENKKHDVIAVDAKSVIDLLRYQCAND